jgi:hypothetical protein
MYLERGSFTYTHAAFILSLLLVRQFLIRIEDDRNRYLLDLPPISARGIIRLFGIAWFLKYL